MIFITLFLILITSLILFVKWKLDYWKRRNVYTPPMNFPFGNVKDNLAGKIQLGIYISKLYNNAKEKGLPYVGLQFFVTPFFIPVDLNLIRKILITDFQHFTDHSNFEIEKIDPLSGHLFNLTGAKWKALRAKLTPLFTSGKLKVMFQTLVDCTKNFHYVMDDAIEHKKPLDIKDTFALYTTDIIGSVAFGIDCNCLKNPNTEFRKYGKKAFQVGLRELLSQIVLLSSKTFTDLLRIRMTKKEVEDFFMGIVRETITYREENNVEKKDFMQLLMNLRNQELKIESEKSSDKDNNNPIYYQNGLTLEEIAAQAFVFFLAGFETSSTTLNFLMFELVQNIEIQEKLRIEIKKVLEAHGGNISYEAVQEMTYLDKCVYETLRKYPPVPAIPRICTKDYKVPDSDLIIEKDTLMMIPAYGVQYDPEFYPNPQKFDPERFSEENKQKRQSCSFLAFGEGPRLCIGLRMGLLQTKVGLIALLRDYKFTLNSKTKVPLEYVGRQFILTDKGGIWVNASRI